jgi:hypothetical protein
MNDSLPDLCHFDVELFINRHDENFNKFLHNYFVCLDNVIYFYPNDDYTWWGKLKKVKKSVHMAKQFQIKGEDFLEIDQSETRIACGGHVC